MPLKQSEAIVLRTYPLHEADLLVTFFTRAEGKVKGVAKSAKKSRRRFGGALEPLTIVRAYWQDKEGQELSRLDSCDILQSPLAGEVDYARLVALSHIAELIDELMPDREANDTVFRLVSSVLAQLNGAAIWMPVTYFELWMVRLTGLLPELGACIDCGEELWRQRAYWHPMVDGVMCARDKRLASNELSLESRVLASEMFRSPAERFAGEPWPRTRAADLRKFLMQIVQRHAERKFTTVSQLERLE